MRMLVPCALATALLAAPANSANSVATTRISGTIPAFCVVDLVSSNMTEHRLTIQIRRQCNTSHDVLISSAPGDALGRVAIEFNRQRLRGAGSADTVYQPEGYYDRIDTLVVRSSDGTAADLRDFAASLRVAVQPS